MPTTLVPLHVHVFVGVRPDRTLSIAQSRLTGSVMVLEPEFITTTQSHPTWTLSLPEHPPVRVAVQGNPGNTPEASQSAKLSVADEVSVDIWNT